MERAETNTTTRMDLRPMDLPALLDRSVELYRQHFLLFAGIMAVTYVPFGLLTFAAALVNEVVHVLAAWAGTLVLLVLWPLQLGATIHAAASLYLGRRTSFRDAYRATFARFWPVFLTGLGLTVAVVLGSLLLAIPGVVVAVLTCFAIHSTVLEDRFYDRAIARSFHLARHDWHRVLLLFAAMGLLKWVLMVTPSIFIVSFLRDSSAVAVADSAWGSLSGAAVLPLCTLPYVFLYFDVRIRREGLDLRVLADRLGPVPPPRLEGPPLEARPKTLPSSGRVFSAPALGQRDSFAAQQTQLFALHGDEKSLALARSGFPARPPVGSALGPCPRCRVLLLPGASFCVACGSRALAGGPPGAEPRSEDATDDGWGRCPTCGWPARGDASFCVGCGAMLEAVS